MRLASVLAGFSLGQADLLRRAMGKKKAEVMAQQRQVFIEGSVKNEVEEETAAHIFDLVQEFASYGFNKSHSAAYGLISYQTAYPKAHYPVAFMAALRSSSLSHSFFCFAVKANGSPLSEQKRLSSSNFFSKYSIPMT